MDDGKQPHLAPIVTVFGGGIAGLSAAHELIERGFYVQVVESAMSPDHEYAAEVGGLARNQFGRVPENPELLHSIAKTNELEAPGEGRLPPESDSVFRTHVEWVRRLRSREMQPVQPRIATPWQIRFVRSPDYDAHPSPFDPALVDDWGVQNATKITALWNSIKIAYRTYDDLGSRPGNSAELAGDGRLDGWRARERLFVEVRGHSNGDRAESENRKESMAWATRVIEQLHVLNGLDPVPVFPRDHLHWHFRAVGVGSAEPIGDQRLETSRERSNRVEFRIVEQLIPGEHGYRFFPAFYRHLFDLMRRTPILDKEGHATGQTAFDLLVPTTQLGIAVGDNRPLEPIETRRVRSIEELRKLSDLFLGRLGVTQRDIVRFQTRLVKFLTSSPQRRLQEYERQSWWTFIGGDDERGYSLPMRKYLMETSQALVAMNADETDARSQGNIVSQLQLHYLKDQCDYTLNGPTSDVWLRPWKKYLKSQGVRFFIGELAALEWNDTKDGYAELVPVTSQRAGWLTPPRQQGARVPDADKPSSAQNEALVARRLKRAIVVEVLDNDSGDYTIVVSGKVHCFSATTQTVNEIAKELTSKLREDDRVWANCLGARIVIRACLGEPLQLRTSSYDFDRSSETSQIRAIVLSAEAMRVDASKSKETLNQKLDEAEDQEGNPQSDQPLAPTLTLNDQEWIAAALLRVKDKEFNERLSKYERTWEREVVPCFTFNAGSLTLNIGPPKWVEDTLATIDPASTSSAQSADFLCPYPFRISIRVDDQPSVEPAKAGGNRKRDSSAPDSHWARETIWVQVRNAHDNLRVVDDPVAEDPNDDYLSASDEPAAFRPDFYVLALPLTEASKLLWRAEKKRPGTLNGSLGEMLDFDRRSSRRTVTGVPIRLNRDVDGRPPNDYPLRDFAGIQYYFQNQVRIGAGHIYYPRAEWGLSSISQLAYWRERMSPASPFIGQLSVDIGDFYRRAPARLGNRVMRSAWNSSSGEIATEVWFQVRQGLDRERAGILVAPSYYHLDQGLSFDHAIGRVFRDKVEIRVNAPPAASTFTVWIHGRRFSCENASDPKRIANRLAKDINAAFPHAVEALVKPRGKEYRLVLGSTIPEGAAFLYVTDGKPGFFEVSLKSAGATSNYSHIQSAGSAEAGAVRDGLFYAMVRDPALPVVAEAIDPLGILLLSKRGNELPRIGVVNDQQQLRVIYGAVLDVRLDQCDGCLAFDDGATATIAQNVTPFLINVPNQWQYRPGLLKPDDDLTFEQTILRPRDDERIRYRISNRRWVAVGTHMATTTQLTTMESASESARHAVNAILRCLSFRAGTDYNSQGRVFADLADVWDPEKHELDDLAPLRRLDSKLVAEGLPHVMDILKITEAVDALPMHGKPSHDPFANALHLAQHFADGFDRDWGFAKQGLNDLLGKAIERPGDAVDPSGLFRELRHSSSHVSERVREFLQGLIMPSGSPAPPGKGPGK